MSGSTAIPGARCVTPPTEGGGPRRVGGPIGVRRLTWLERFWCLVMALGCGAMLVIGARLSPSPTGLGTHTQMGIPPCGWQWSMGIPCATCGMTTAVSHAAHGDVWSSVKAQPFGFLVALGAAVTFWVSLHGAFTGSRVDRVLWWFLRPRWLVLGGVAFLGAWGYKLALAWGAPPGG